MTLIQYGNPKQTPLTKAIEIKQDQEKEYLRMKVFSLLYDNSISAFEDAIDMERMSIRRYLCFITLSFLSDDNRYNSFLIDAKNSLCKLHDGEIKQKAILLLNVIDILLTCDNENVSEKSIKLKIQNAYLT